MPLIVTPRQLRLRGEFYHQLGALLSAGLPLVNALESLLKSPPARSFRKPITRLLEELEHGSTFSEAMSQAGAWLPEFDIALLQAGEQSGRLDQCFKLLSGYYTERAQLVEQVKQRLSYPLFIVHFGVFIWPFPQFFLTGSLSTYLSQTVGALLPFYAVAFLLLLACQGRHGERWRSVIEKVCRFIPMLGTARRHLALARLSAALEALLNAGVSMVSAWELAAAASGSPALRRAVLTWRPRLEDDGQPPSEVLSECSEFPEMFANQYHTGEISGTLDDTLRRLQRYYQEEGSRKLQMLSEWAPRLIYLAIMIVIAHQVVSFWVGYYNGILNVFE